MGKDSVHIGEEGQEWTTNILNQRGFHMVERIGTPAKKVNGRMIFLEKVSGDHRALGSGGRSVLVETKTRLSDDRLRYHFFEEHQREALQQHHELGGFSLVSWVSEHGIFLLRWPIPNFEPGLTITAEDARRLDIRSLKQLEAEHP